MQKTVVKVCFFLGLLWSAFISIVGFFPLLFGGRFGHWFEQLFAKGWCFLLGIKIHWKNLDRLYRYPSMILAPNHQSMFDIMVVYLLPIKFYWIAKKQLSYIPFFGWALWACGTYFVRRDKSGHDVKVVMKRVEDGLKGGRSILMFPEGTRSRNGELLPFKKGAFRMAQKTGVPLIPVGILGTFEIAPAKSLPTHLGHQTEVRIGEPFFVGADEVIEESMERFREVLVALLHSSPQEA